MSRPLCILIHGFTGNSVEVLPLAEALSQSGYDVETPLLPGHHHVKRRMAKVQAFEWIYAIEELTKRAIHEQRTIHLIGFSMGAMIALILGCRYPVRTLVLLSPPVYVFTPNVLIGRSKRTLRLLRKNRSSYMNTMRNNFTGLFSTPLYNVAQFHKVVRDAKKAVPFLRTPVCIVHGLEDEIVDPKSSEWIYTTVSSPNRELHILPHSGHVVCHGLEVNLLVETVISFLKKHG